MNETDTGTCRSCGQEVPIWTVFLPYRVLIDHQRPEPSRSWCGGSQMPPRSPESRSVR